MKSIFLGLVAVISLFSSASFSAEAIIQPKFCGFFLDRKPLTVDIKSDKTATLSYEGKEYQLSVTKYQVDGIPHGYECDDSEFCVTGIQYILEGPGTNFEIYDSWQGQSASAFGRNDMIHNFHTVVGQCE